MLQIDIPDFGFLQLSSLVMDYNGTLACDGLLLDGVKEKINFLAEKMQIYVITADTFGKAEEQLAGVNCQLHIAPKENQAEAKLDFIKKLDAKKTVAIGNGRNDNLMLKNAVLGIAVLQKEGVASATFLVADLVCANILDALDLFVYPLRLVATLRS